MYPAGFNASFTLRRRIDVSDIEKTAYIVKRAGIWYTDIERNQTIFGSEVS